jgi:hypothetical protein
MLATIHFRIFCLSVSHLKTQILKHRTTILLVVLYRCGTWKEHRLRKSENRMLGIYEPKTLKVTEGYRKLHNEELHNLFSSPNIFRMIKLRRISQLTQVTRMRKIRNVYKTLV